MTVWQAGQEVELVEDFVVEENFYNIPKGRKGDVKRARTDGYVHVSFIGEDHIIPERYLKLVEGQRATPKQAMKELVQDLGLDPALVSEDTRFEILSGSEPARFTLTVEIFVPNALSNKYLEAVGASFRLEEQ